MKLLLVDFVRRRWWVYLLLVGVSSLVAATDISVKPHARAEFLWVVFFTFPWWFDLAGRSSSVTTMLPLSRKALGLYCFILAVCVPVILLLLDIVVATQVFNSSIIFSWTDFVFVALGALVVAGVVCLLVSYFPAKTADDGNESFPTTVWLVGMLPFFGGRVETLYHGPLAWISIIFLGLPATAWAFVRSEKLIIGRARNLPGSPPKARKAIVPARHSAVHLSIPIPSFVERIRAGIMVAVTFLLFIIFLKWKVNQILIFGMWIFVLSVSIPRQGALRLIRTLPLSTNQLAFWLLLEPLFILAPLFLLLVAIPIFVPGSFSPIRVASLLLLAAGAGSVGNGFGVHFGFVGSYTSMILLGGFGFAVLASVPIAGLPAIVGWLLGSALFCFGFSLIRDGLRSSDSYQARKETMFS